MTFSPLVAMVTSSGIFFSDQIGEKHRAAHYQLKKKAQKEWCSKQGCGSVCFGFVCFFVHQGVLTFNYDIEEQRQLAFQWRLVRDIPSCCLGVLD